jgi:uncharacterized protein (UPF0303 family)
MKIEELIAIVEQQEALLQFKSFNRADAWKLGNIFVKKIREHDYPMAVSLRMCSGLALFHYAWEGTSLNNEDWMNRKFNVVKDLDMSSLLNMLKIMQRGTTMEERGLDPKVYAWGGGGFPIRIKGTGLVGTALVSGLPGKDDHAVLVDCIAEFLKVQNVPQLPADANI